MLTAILLKGLRKLILVVIMSFVFASILGMAGSREKVEEANTQIEMIDGLVHDYRKKVHLDTTRALALEKITGIMRRYNKRMSDSLRYEIANEIHKMSVKYENLDIDLICATITHESALSWRPTVVSPAGALGLMQIMPYTGSFLSKHEGVEWTSAEEVLFDPINNIRMGCRYLSMLIELYNVDGGLAAYNGGETRAARWLASGRDDEVLFEETRGYVPAVLKLYDIYRN